MVLQRSINNPPKPKGQMFIMRGLPGSGKSTVVETIRHNSVNFMPRICSADDFFMVDGRYDFRPWLIGQAHEACKIKAFRAMMDGVDVFIDNTNSCKWEFELYVLWARQLNYRCIIIDLFDSKLSDEELAARCKHGVPVDSIAKMRARWEK